MFVLYRETASGVFDLGGARHFSDVLADLVRRLRDGERGALVIKSEVTGDLVYRSEAIPDYLPAGRLGVSNVGGKGRVDFGVSVVGASPSQHVQVKSAVESQYETGRAGGQTVSGVRF